MSAKIEVTIQHKTAEGWPVVAEYSKSNRLPLRSEGLLELSEEQLTSLTTEANLKQYGTILGKALFRDTIRDGLMQARAHSEGNLRLLLVVEDPMLKPLHWERLCAPLRLAGRWDFLALDQQVLFSLYLPSLTDRIFPPIGRRDLRALILVANLPADNKFGLARFDTAATVASVQTALGKIPHDLLANDHPDACGPASLLGLIHQLTKRHYTMLHIVAHGWFRQRDGETILYLLDEHSQPKPTSATNFLERIDRMQGAKGLPHLVFLSTCESADPAAERAGALGGLAQRMVRELGLPAVVAMTEKISILMAEILARNFYERLRASGEVDRALVEASTELAEAYDITVPALYSRLGERPLFSDTLDRELTASEIEYGADILQELLPQRAPILQEEAAEYINILEQYLHLHEQPEALSEAAQAEWDDALAHLNIISEEVLDLNFRALALGRQPPSYDARCPFPGLYAFQSHEAEFFFGREVLVRHLGSKLRKQDFLAVLGGSGSGKSSLILAGLIPMWQAQQPELRPIIFSPGSRPLAYLEQTLNQCRQTPEKPLMVVVDQFEELFTLCRDPQERQAFVSGLLLLLLTPEILGLTQCKLVITMRADFWGECAVFSDLKEAMQANQELVAPMTSIELRSAMEQQAAKVGLRFEADLIPNILQDVEGEPGAMPLLQHLLKELWERRHGRWLRASQYRAIGGIQQAIAGTAEKIYGNLSKTEGKLVRNIFVRLTRIDEESSRGQQRNTRRRVEFTELVPANGKAERVRQLVQQLADARLVVTTVNPVNEAQQVEVAHEALLRYWPRLLQWLDEERDILRIREGIRRAVQEFKQVSESRQSTGLFLHRGSRLREIETLLAGGILPLNKEESRYIQGCIMLREREAARKKAIEEREKEALRMEAEAARKLAQERVEFAERLQEQVALAEKQTRLARAGELAVQVQFGLTSGADPDLLLLLAIEAILITLEVDGEVTPSADAALRQVVRRMWPQKRVNHPHAGPIWSVAFQADGEQFVTASRDRTAVIYNMETLSQQLRIQHRRQVRAAQLSPDGAILATVGSEKTAHLWDVNTGTPLRDFIGHTHQLYDVAFSPDGSKIITASSDYTAKLWDVETGEMLQNFGGHTNDVTCVTFAGTGRLVLTGSTDTTARLWMADSGEMIQTYKHATGISALASSPTLLNDSTEQLIASASVDGVVELWSAYSGHRFNRLEKLPATVTALAFSPDGRTLIVGCTNSMVYLWDVQLGEQRGMLHHPDVVTDLAHHPHDKLLLSSTKTSLHLWFLNKDAQYNHLKSLGHILTLAFSPVDKIFALGKRKLFGDAKTLSLWRLGEKTPYMELMGQAGQVHHVVFSPNGKLLLTTSNSEREAVLWDVTTGEVVCKLTGHIRFIQHAAFSPTGELIVTTSRDKTARLWRTETGEELACLRGHTRSVFRASFTTTGDWIITASRDDTARLWNVETGAEVACFNLSLNNTHSVAVSKDGRIFITAERHKTGLVKIWMAYGSPPDEVIVHHVYSLHEHKHEVNSVAFSPDDQQFLTASSDTTIRLWDISALLLRYKDNPPAPDEVPLSTDLVYEVRRLSEHSSEVLLATFSPDGSTIASVSNEGSVRIWPSIPKLLDRAEDLIQRDPPRLTDAERSQYGLI